MFPSCSLNVFLNVSKCFLMFRLKDLAFSIWQRIYFFISMQHLCLTFSHVDCLSSVLCNSGPGLLPWCEEKLEAPSPLQARKGLHTSLICPLVSFSSLFRLRDMVLPISFQRWWTNSRLASVWISLASQWVVAVVVSKVLGSDFKRPV